MKKLFLLLLIVVGGVMQASAWSDNMYLRADGHWDDNYSGYQCTRISENEFYIQLDGAVIQNGKFYFRFYHGDYTYDSNYAGNKQVVGPTNFYEDNSSWCNQDVEVTTSKVTSSNVDNWQNKSFYIEQNSNAAYVDIYMKWADDTWNITAAVLEKNIIAWNNSEQNWENVYAYTYDQPGDHRKIEQLGAWGGTPLSSSDNSCVVYVTSSARAIFHNGSGAQTANLFIVDRGIYKGLSATNPYALNVSISSVGYATFSSLMAVDFSALAESVLAKKASVDSDGRITYETVTKAASREGVLLQSVSGSAISFELPLHSDQTISSNEGNAFVGITLKQKLAQSTADGYTNYVLAVVNGELGFYKVNTNGSWCAAGTAYLKAPTKPSGAPEFISLNGETTAIGTIEHIKKDNIYYDLNGHCIAEPTKGVYILNGKKVVVK